MLKYLLKFISLNPLTVNMYEKTSSVIFVFIGLMVDFSSASVLKYFNELAEKPTPLLFCPETPGVLFRIPPLPVCSIPKEVDNSTIVRLTLFWEDITSQPIEAYECWGESQVIIKHWSFMTIVTKKDVVKLEVGRAECQEMILNHVAPNGKSMKQVQSGFYSTCDNGEPEDTWFARSYTRENYFASLSVVTVSNTGDDKIKTLSATKADCVVSSEFCPTVKGVLVWDSKGYRKCRMKVGDTVSCIKTGDMISCNEIKTTVSGWETGVYCGVNVAVSHQRLIFATEVPFELHKDVDSAENIRVKMGLGKERRDLSSALVKADELAGKLQYLSELLDSKVHYAVIQFHETTCHMQQLDYRFLVGEALNGNPHLLVQSFLGDKKYRAKASGDAISVWHCEEIW